jgi:hypothetical protein
VDTGFGNVVGAGFATTLFTIIFIAAGFWHPLRPLIRDRRVIVSFGSGMAIAYVFMGTMPDLHHARSAFVATAPLPLPYEGMAIYYLALAGFLIFYGLDHLRTTVEDSAIGGKALAFSLHIGGFAAYVCLIVLLLGEEFNPPVDFGLYSLAIGFHFLAIDHTLREMHPQRYDRVGRFILAAMCVAGWGMSRLFVLPHALLALLVAFISGAIIVNSSISELPNEKDGRFLPFVAGGALYGLLLWLLG